MWWGQHHRVKEIKTLHDFYYLIFSKYDDSPNYGGSCRNEEQIGEKRFDYNGGIRHA